MKKLSLVHATCLVACGVSLSNAIAQSKSSTDTAEIIVTAARTEQDLQTAPIGATIITKEQIASAGVLDANEAIRKIGGIAAKSDLNGGREYSIDLRGFGATADNNTVVLVDGIRISENEQSSARLSAIAANSIERIEIIRGGSSVMWGEGATSGVINIITRKDGKAGVSGQVGVGVESFGERDGTAVLRVGSESGKAVFDINARSNSSTGYRANNQSSQDVISMGLAAGDSGLNFRTHLDHESADNRFPGPLTFAQFQANPRQAQTDQLNNWGTLQQTRFSTGVDYSFGSWTAIVDMGIKSKSTTNLFASFGATTPSTTTSDTTQFSPRAVYKGSISDTALTTNIGVDVSQWQYNNNGAFDPINFVYTTRTGNQTNRAAFLMTDWLLPSQTRIVAGYRSENISKSSQDASNAPVVNNLNNNLTASELSVNQTIKKGIDVYARFATSYRMANIDDYAGNGPFVNLQPQTSRDQELGLKLRQGVHSFTIRYFVQNTINEIAFNPVTFSNMNLDPTARNGIELQASSEMSSKVTLSGNLQVMKAIFNGGVNAGNHIPGVAEQSGSIRATYKIDTQQSVESAWRMLGSQYVSGDNSNTCGAKIPSNQLLDALYRWQAHGLDLSFGATNLMNKNVFNYAYGCTAGLISGIYPDQGRTLRAALKYNF